MKTATKKELTAIAIYQGVMTVIDEYGNVVYYRQRGIDKLSRDKLRAAIASGLLQANILDIPELPKQYKVVYEREDICGKAPEVFTLPK